MIIGARASGSTATEWTGNRTYQKERTEEFNMKRADLENLHGCLWVSHKMDVMNRKESSPRPGAEQLPRGVEDAYIFS